MMYYITTHSKNVNLTKIVKAHFEKSDVPYMFVYGKGCTAPIEPYLEVECEESYENLPLKTFLILEHFLASGHNYMAKLDDDTLLDIEKCKAMTLTEDYVGVFNTPDISPKNSIYHWYKIQNKSFKVPKKIPNIPYAQGACYFLSRKAAEKAYSKGKEFYENTPRNYLGEDVKIGLALSDSIIQTKNIKAKEDVFYEIAEDFLFVHPVHILIYNKLKVASNETKRTLLAEYNILNTNNKREAYLTNILAQSFPLNEDIIINNSMPLKPGTNF